MAMAWTMEVSVKMEGNRQIQRKDFRSCWMNVKKKGVKEGNQVMGQDGVTEMGKMERNRSGEKIRSSASDMLTLRCLETYYR